VQHRRIGFENPTAWRESSAHGFEYQRRGRLRLRARSINAARPNNSHADSGADDDRPLSAQLHPDELAGVPGPTSASGAAAVVPPTALVLPPTPTEVPPGPAAPPVPVSVLARMPPIDVAASGVALAFAVVPPAPFDPPVPASAFAERELLATAPPAPDPPSPLVLVALPPAAPAVPAPPAEVVLATVPL